MNVVHVFPYSPFVSGGHSNAITGFVLSQRSVVIEAVGIAPMPPRDIPVSKCRPAFPLKEIDSIQALNWSWIADRFGFPPSETVVHIHTIDGTLSGLLKSLRIAKVPYVLTSHGQLHFRTGIHWAEKFLYLNFLNRDIRKAAAIHYLTSGAFLRARLLLPSFAGCSFVQPHALDVPELSAVPALPNGDLDIPPDAFIWLFLGRLDVHVKGLDLLLEAFSQLDPQRYWMVFAGPDWCGGKMRLEELALKYKCENRIRFTGPVYGEMKWRIFKMAGGFASPSRWDALPVAILEAMACGLPIITSEEMGPASDFSNAEAARICKLRPAEIAKEMALVSGDASLRQSLARNGKAWVNDHCSPQSVGAAFQAMYLDVMQRRTAREKR